MKPFDLTIYGIGTPALTEVQKGYFIDTEIAEDFLKLKTRLQKEGFELSIVSSYRSFEKQLSIWNRKATGALQLLDKNGKKMERPQDEVELMRAILIWSALPGASRHHLGTDLDIIDANAVPEGYEVELTPAECAGMFAPFHKCLSALIEKKESFGFERVFIPNRGSIQPEPWHIAHLPTSRKRLQKFSLKTLQEIYENSEIACKNAIILHLDELFQNYIKPYFI